jgi:GxxExxY protein
MKENEIGTIIVDCAVELHRNLGPGLLETVYEVTLARALERRGLKVERQVGVAIEYEGETFDEGFRADLIVEELVIVELKSVERVTPAHKKQLLTYLRLTGLKLGYLLNFGEALMRDGITRTINGYLDSEPPCLGASVREEFIEPSAEANGLPPVAQP